MKNMPAILAYKSSVSAARKRERERERRVRAVESATEKGGDGENGW